MKRKFIVAGTALALIFGAAILGSGTACDGTALRRRGDDGGSRLRVRPGSDAWLRDDARIRSRMDARLRTWLGQIRFGTQGKI